MSGEPRYKASPRRVVTALFVGAFVGGVLVASTQFAVIRLGLGGGHYGATLGGMAVTSVVGSLLFAAGLVAVSPVWFVLDQQGHREPWMAALLGGGLSVVAPIAFSLAITASDHRLPPPPDWRILLEFLTPMAVIGCLVGLAVWRIAYRRTLSA